MNIVFILSDQQRWDTLGCYGQPLDVTPHLDSMAAEGVRFEYAFTSQPVCGPARSCLQTGQWATETGCFRNNVALPLNARTIAHELRDCGYEVGYIGKWHLASTGSGLNHLPSEDTRVVEQNYQTRPVPPERRGGYNGYWLASDVLEFTCHGYGGHLFDQGMRKVEFKGYRVDRLTDFALEFLRSRERQMPFFLFLSYVEPHHQNDHHRFEGPEGSKQRFLHFTPPADLAALEGDWPEQFRDYLGCCFSLDHNVGRIRQELELSGLAEETLIIYTSDHGCHFRTRNQNLGVGNYDDYKRSCHEASIRVPLIMCGPGFKQGKVIDELVSLIDLPPTLLVSAGREVPSRMGGRPLQMLVDGRARGWPEEVFLQISESQVGRAIRTKRWKYAVRAAQKSGIMESCSDEYVEDFLYDLEHDPAELRNLVHDPSLAAERRELANRLVERMVAAGEQRPRIRPA